MDTASPAPMIDLTALHRAVAQLQEALALWQAQPENSVLKPHLRAASIQAFEYSYELALRMMRRVLIERALTADLVQDLSFNDLLRIGADAGLIPSPDAWRQWRALRNATSHTYDASKAAQVVEMLPAFLGDVQLLVVALHGALNSA